MPGLDYWLELSAQGNDNCGPVLQSGKVWEDGDSTPDCAQLVVTDPDGLPHTAQTLNPNSDIQIGFGTSFDLGQQPSSTARIDDLSITLLSGCSAAPFIATRTLWNDKTVAEGQ